ncbi:hypothetical protein M2360_004325 [Rhizobium sp. SG_E_25_P2]|uniref:hypothetical protein n=1 Tax=Rhizobium sp. SG_E_25_P2 TaxID=2879942 RepID=UPI0024753FD2|nr:hypothetical protein [Rhizobium sp. SG_E_25_P2]MDH6268906.1 hypothetical protein [Rhizobium sp. SG_E_25_P2]
MSSLKMIHKWAASMAVGGALLVSASVAARAQNAPQEALDMPATGQENCHVRPDGQAAPAEPLTERLQDCNSVLKPKGLGDPDIVEKPPKLNDPMAITPPPPASP